MFHGALKTLMVHASTLLGLANAETGRDAPPGGQATMPWGRALEPAIHRLETIIEERQDQLRTHRERRNGAAGR